ERGVGGGAVGIVEKTMNTGIAVVTSDNQARVVDAACLGLSEGRRIVEGFVGATAVEEAVHATGVVVITDDLPHTVDRLCNGAGGSRGLVERGVGATAFEKAMEGAEDAAGLVLPDDLVRIIDAECLGAAGNARGIVEGVENIDWHNTNSSLIFSLGAFFTA